MELDPDVGAEDVVVLLGSVPEAVIDLLGGLDQTRLRYRHGPAFWTVAELTAHLAEAGCAADALLARIYREGLAQVPPRAYDPPLRAAPENGEEVNARRSEELVQDYARSRRRAVDLLRGMRPEDWERRVQGAEAGEMTVLELGRLVARHEMGHLSQLRNLLSLLPQHQDLGPLP